MLGLDSRRRHAEAWLVTSATVRLIEDVPDQLLTNLDGRDGAVWLMPAFAAAAGPDLTARILGLPWSLGLSEAGDAPLLAALEAQEEPDDPLVRRRGMILLVDVNPADVPLPRRSLPIFLLNGNDVSSTGDWTTVPAPRQMRGRLNDLPDSVASAQVDDRYQLVGQAPAAQLVGAAT